MADADLSGNDNINRNCT